MPPCPIFTASLPYFPFLPRFDFGASFASSTNSGEAATSFLISFTIDIDVGPEGLTTPNRAEMGPVSLS